MIPTPHRALGRPRPTTIASEEDSTRDSSRTLMLGVYTTIFGVLFAHAVVLPSLSSYLGSFHASTPVLGYALAATCIGEFLMAPIFTMWYDTSPPRDLATGALLLSSAGSLMYALARNSTMVVVSRFLVGAAAGVQAPLMSMAAAMVGRGAASSTITGLRSMHIVAWILGTGSAAIATFVHTPAPGMMGHMDHQIPHYMRMMHRMSANTSYGYADSIGAISGLTISPDGGDRHGPRRALLSDSPVGASDPDAGRLEERGSLQGAGVGQLGARVPALLHTAAKKAAVTQASHASRAGEGDAKSQTSAKVGAAPQEEQQLGGAVAGAAQQRGRGAGENAGVGARARSAEVSGAGGAGWHSRTPRQGVWEEAGRWGGGRVPASGRPEGTLDRVEDSIEEAGRDIQPIIKEGTDEVKTLGDDVVHFKVAKAAKRLNQMRETTQRDLGLNGIESVGNARAGQRGVRTDRELASEIGDHRMYMPGYVTAVVGHGLAAPGYIAALVALLALVNVFRTMDQNHLLVDKPAIPRAQIAPTGRPAAGLIAPLAVCFAIESLFQAWWSSVETLVSPITGIYLGYTIDATAVFMMGIAASGMVGLALSEGLLTSTTPRFMAFAGCLLVVAGLLCCVPWFGHLSATSYVLGCYTSAIGFMPLSNLALHAYQRGVGRAGGEYMSALLFYWQATSMPARILVPVVLSLWLEGDGSASLCYVTLTVLALGVTLLVVQSRRAFAPSDQDGGGAEAPIIYGQAPGTPHIAGQFRAVGGAGGAGDSDGAVLLSPGGGYGRGSGSGYGAISRR